MNTAAIFILRTIMGGVLAVVITRVFRPGAGPLFTAGLAVLMIATAYVLDHYRKR